MHDFVENTLSPLVQVIFIIALLAMLADARPETVIKMVLDAVVSIIETTLKLSVKIFEIIFKILEFFFSKKGSGSKRKPKPTPPPDIQLVEVEVLPPKD